MKIGVLGLNYPPEPVGIGPYTHGVVQALADAGHQVHVVTAKPYYPSWTNHPDYARPRWHRERADGVAVVRCPLYVPRAPSGLRRILHHLSFALAATGPMLAVARWRPAIVVVVAPSLLSVPLAWLAARLAGARLWIHVQDFEVEAAFATGLVKRRGWLARIARATENRLLRSADLVSTIGPHMHRKLIEKGVAAVRARELRNWANDSFAATDAGVAEYRERWQLGDAHVALYSGNLANKQGVRILIDAARRIADRADIAVVICGEGPNRAALAQAAADLPNVRLHPLQPAGRMGDLLALATVHLLPQLPQAADLVLPSKLTNMLASGRPVIATTEPGTGLFDEVAGCGIATPPGDAAALADAIVALVDDAPRRATLGRAAAGRARERWSRSAILAQFVAAAERLAAKKLGAA